MSLSKLERIVTTPGDGKTFPKQGDTLKMHYTGRLISNGSQFDTSVGKGPFEFRIGLHEVIEGWDQGVLQMSLGECAVLKIPSEMAYGQDGVDGIPPNSDLEFDVELVGVNDQLASGYSESCILL